MNTYTDTCTDTYTVPSIKTPAPLGPNEVVLVASGGQWQSANWVCWPTQQEVEEQLAAALADERVTIRRGHQYDPDMEHGFIWSQRMGMDVFKHIPSDAPLIVAEAVGQDSHYLLAGLRSHRGPILTVGKWSGQWPGLGSMLNLNGSLTKMGVAYSTIWSEDYSDAFFRRGLRQWLREGRISHDTSHVRDLDPRALPAAEGRLGAVLAHRLRQEKSIIGVFDEGCMGIYNAIIDDELLNSCGIYKERLSQASLVAAMRMVTDAEADTARGWLVERGMRFVTGQDEATQLTDRQIRRQLKMYVSAVRIAHALGCDAIGIQYQQGFNELAFASDLAEGLLNNVQRPPVYDVATGAELFAGQAVPHFNKVDEGVAVDSLVTNRIWNAMGLDPATALYEVRWGQHLTGEGIDDFVWIFMPSGAIPAAHIEGGYAGARSERQPAIYFRLGGGTLKGISKSGEIVWSRIYVMAGALHADLGRASVVALPEDETVRRWHETTPQWPIMHAVLHGITRDQMLARQKANHLNVAYAPNAAVADKALAAKAAMLHELGIAVHLCGRVVW